ncbi:hypothetical protein C1H76_3706 [Elsinoe australis]|uniref:RSE1/DDB1/CPSF1 first beta-propeller domain-containing protein n=1 Tax=Elsinoe australis TaxID=40998 RepID=A0A4U7AZD4_9PEZI|nr:hypothetical protein C1H76_3706 [Elsinoe australis]
MNTSTTTLGLLTRTLSPGTGPRQILKLRPSNQDQHFNQDVFIFFGDRCFELFGIEENGLLRRLNRTNLDGRVLAAEVVRRSNAGTGLGDLLAVTLDNAYLVIYRIVFNPSGLKAEIACNRPFPKRVDPLERLGSLLAIDNSSHVIATAAPEHGLMVWKALSSHPEDTVNSPGSLTDRGPLRLEGQGPLIELQDQIVLMSVDGTRDSAVEHSSLLLIQIIKSKVVLRQLTLDVEYGRVEIQEPQRIDPAEVVPDLLIPLGIPGYFVLASARGLMLYNAGASSGNTLVKRLGPIDVGPHGQKVIDETAVWTSWTSDASTADQDSISYLVLRSDGLVANLELDVHAFVQDGTCKVHLNAITFTPHPLDGGVSCFRDPSSGALLLAVSGDRCDGGLYDVQIGKAGGIQNGSLVLSRLQPPSNCSPTLDFISSNLPRSHDSSPRVGESLFLTSGGPDTGRIVEQRPGLDASMIFSLDFNAMGFDNRLWIAKSGVSGSSVFLMSDSSSPDSAHTSLLLHDGEGMIGIDSETIGMLSADDTGLGSLQITDPTVYLSLFDGYTVHVTHQTVYLYSAGGVKEIVKVSPEDLILKADALYELDQTSLLMSTVSTSNDGSTYKVQALCFSNEPNSEAIPLFEESVALPPTTVKVVSSTDGVYMVFALDGAIHIRNPGKSDLQAAYVFEGNSTTPSACEEILVLNDQFRSAAHLLCALRDGSLVVLEMRWSGHDIHIVHLQTFTLGLTPVNIVSYSARDQLKSASAIAICDSRLFLVQASSDQKASAHFTINPLWITDKDEPDFQITNILAVSQVPHDLYLDGINVRGCLAVITGSACLIAHLDESSGPTVPRALAVRSSPSRILYSKRLGHFAIGGSCIDPDTDALGGTVEFVRSSKRNIIKTEDGIEDVGTSVHFPGERLLCMTEWVHESRDGKKFAFLLVGTGVENTRTQSNGRIPSSGRVHLLQPKLSHGVVESAAVAKTTKFDLPVRAISLYGANGYICSHGTTISYYMYSALNKKWQQVCAYRLHSPAVHITTPPPHIHITTATDSLMTLQLLGPDPEANDDNLTPTAFRFHLTTVDTTSALGQHHLTLPSPFITPQTSALNILTTKTSSLRGLLHPLSTSPSPNQSKQTSDPLFTASLPASLIRLRSHNTSLLPAQPRYSITGLTTDGALMGLKLLGPHEWAVLKYVETLCRRSRRVCPSDARHLRAGPAVEALREGSRREEEGEGMDVDEGEGMERVETDEEGRRWRGGWEVLEELPRSERWGQGDMHVDGDLLGRLLEEGEVEGRKLLEEVLGEEAKREDRIGLFVAERMEEERNLVMDTIKLIRKVLASWGYW